ncbi:hypothetical protein AWM70_05645 [Paenibacillus yonginensis]|uniref:histidine kinase n=1 Tax=Paenibacillus yonginensis TaxID=1462996 RepID=A0A1B1MY68_9BACL|nr:ATP-binding protein [Paenibacillus yonginensis]ANS74124.1 hypothetical protein AWM70_05645 [Paenibacillus yonginensis]
MSYKLTKWLILLFPPLLVGLWELVRHTLLMPYFSMSAGNVVTPILLFLISLMLLLPLFSRMERFQEELQQERAVKAKLEAREQLASELHDGIAQSLFLLAVKLEKAEKQQLRGEEIPLDELRKTVHTVNDYVRQSISNLRYSVDEMLDEGETLPGLIAGLGKEIQMKVHMQWRLAEGRLTVQEKIELLACVREAVMNARKHSGQAEVYIEAAAEDTGWKVEIRDQGKGIAPGEMDKSGTYGLRIVRERAAKMGWQVQLDSREGSTSVILYKP